MTGTPALQINRLDVAYATPRGPLVALDAIDLTVGPGEIVGIVGESGSGKSTLAATITGTLSSRASHSADIVRIAGVDMLRATDAERRAVRRDRLGMVGQNPMTGMDPTRKVRRSFADISVGGDDASTALRAVGLEDTDRVLASYPHQLSGGMAQRVAIALALTRRPRLVVADEPTSALDADVAGAVLNQLMTLARSNDAALLLITHDLSIVERHCSRVVVMRGGRILEDGPVERVFREPSDEYTNALLAATRALDAEPRAKRSRSTDTAIDVQQVSVDFSTGPPWQRERQRALDDVSVQVAEGEMLGVIGPSGSGKSTLCRVLLGLQRPDSGTVLIDGAPFTATKRQRRGTVQVVLQHPDWALNPTLRVGRAIAEPLAVVERVRGTVARDRVVETMERLGLEASLADRYPHELSGGQRQRASIARALIAQPRLIVFDEAVSSLDVSVQAQVLREIRSAQAAFGFTGVFVSHDAGAVAYIADRVIRMEAGSLHEVTHTALDTQALED